MSEFRLSLRRSKRKTFPFLAESAHADACAPGNLKDASVEDLKDLFRQDHGIKCLLAFLKRAPANWPELFLSVAFITCTSHPLVVHNVINHTAEDLYCIQEEPVRRYRRDTAVTRAGFVVRDSHEGRPVRPVPGRGSSCRRHPRCRRFCCSFPSQPADGDLPRRLSSPAPSALHCSSGEFAAPISFILTGASMHFCRALNNVHRVFFHVLVDLCGLTANLDLHLRLVRDNIPSTSGNNGSHILLWTRRRSDAESHKGLRSPFRLPA